MSTKQRLAEALRQAGLEFLAVKAEAGDYDEIESQSALPLTDLIGDLAIEMINGNEAAKQLRQAAIDGDFDNTPDEWRLSEEEDDDGWF